MGLKVIRRFCKDWGEKRPHEKQGVNHVLHLLLTVLTVGLWLLVWIVLVVLSAFRPYRCRTCGRAVL